MHSKGPRARWIEEQLDQTKGDIKDTPAFGKLDSHSIQVKQLSVKSKRETPPRRIISSGNRNTTFARRHALSQGCSRGSDSRSPRVETCLSLSHAISPAGMYRAELRLCQSAQSARPSSVVEGASIVMDLARPAECPVTSSTSSSVPRISTASTGVDCLHPG